VIGIGLLGYGYWGPNLARCFGEHADCRLTVVHDRDPAMRTRAERRHLGTRIAATAAEVFEDPAVDAVAIATPVSTHWELGLGALQAGKHVLIEKPIAASEREASALVDAAARAGRILMVDHTFVYTPAVQKIRELVDAGALGALHYYDSVRVNLGLFQSDVNVLWDLAVHDLAILGHIFDESPISITAQTGRHLPGRPESMALVTLAYPSGAVAHVNVNWLAPVKVRQTLLGGSKKMLVYNDLEPSEKIKVYDRGAHVIGDRAQSDALRVGYRTGDMWAPHLPSTEPLRNLVDHFVDCIRTGRRPRTDGQVGREIVGLLEAAECSAREGGLPVSLGIERLAS